MIFTKKKILSLFFFISLLLSAIYLFFNENGILKYIKMKNELRKLDEEINRAEEKLHTLEMEIDSLKNNKEKIEKVAREHYHMLKPSEKVLRVDEY